MSASVRSSRGFTLVELIIALTLIGIMSAALFSALRFSGRAWDTAQTRAERTSDEDAIRNFLRVRLEETQPRLIFIGNDMQEAAFMGTETSLRFASFMPPDVGLGGTYLFRLSPLDNGRGLTLDWSLLRPKRQIDISDGRTRPRILFGPETGVLFRYYGRKDEQRNQDLPAQWFTRWDTGYYLPSLIEMTFFDAEGNSLGPPLLAHPLEARPDSGS